jgi:hypothetical protein
MIERIGVIGRLCASAPVRVVVVVVVAHVSALCRRSLGLLSRIDRLQREHRAMPGRVVIAHDRLRLFQFGVGGLLAGEQLGLVELGEALLTRCKRLLDLRNLAPVARGLAALILGRSTVLLGGLAIGSSLLRQALGLGAHLLQLKKAWSVAFSHRRAPRSSCRAHA